MPLYFPKCPFIPWTALLFCRIALSFFRITLLFSEVPFCFLGLPFSFPKVLLCLQEVPLCVSKMLYCFLELFFSFPEKPSFYLLYVPFSKNSFFPANCTFSSSCSELLRETIFVLPLFCLLFKLFIDQLMVHCILLVFPFKK